MLLVKFRLRMHRMETDEPISKKEYAKMLKRQTDRRYRCCRISLLA